MNKKEYIADLSYQLKGLEKEEFLEAIRYIEEYFDEAGIENESAVMDELGSPSSLAAIMKAEAAIKTNKEDTQKEKTDTQTVTRNKSSNIKTIFIIIVGIFALPIALPIASAVVALLFALCMVVLALVLSGIAVAIALFVIGIPALVSSIQLIAVNFADGIVALGISLIAIGLAILFITLFTYALRFFVSFASTCIAKLFEKLNQKRKPHTQKEGASI